MYEVKVVAYGDGFTAGESVFKKPGKYTYLKTPYTHFLQQRIDDCVRERSMADDMSVQVLNISETPAYVGPNGLYRKFSSDFDVDLFLPVQKVLDEEPKLCIVFAGAEDMHEITTEYGNMQYPSDEMEAHKAVDLTAEHLFSIYDGLMKSGIEVVPVTIPPHGVGYVRTRENTRFRDVQRGLITALNTRIQMHSVAKGMGCVDIYSAVVGEDGWMKDEYNGNGLYFNMNGYALLAELVFEKARSSLYLI